MVYFIEKILAQLLSGGVYKVKAFLILKKGEKIIQNFNNKTLLLASIISWNKSFSDYDPMRIIMALDGSGQIVFSS